VTVTDTGRRHPARVPAPRLRRVPAGGRRNHPALRRQRTRPGDHQAVDRAPRRDDRRRERARAGFRVHTVHPANGPDDHGTIVSGRGGFGRGRRPTEWCVQDRLSGKGGEEQISAQCNSQPAPVRAEPADRQPYTNLFVQNPVGYRRHRRRYAPPPCNPLRRVPATPLSWHKSRVRSIWGRSGFPRAGCRRPRRPVADPLQREVTGVIGWFAEARTRPAQDRNW
jgi:hypothetical protein